MYAVLLASWLFAQRGCACTTVAEAKPGDSCWSLWTRAGMTEAEFLQANQGITCQPLKPSTTVCLQKGANLPITSYALPVDALPYSKQPTSGAPASPICAQKIALKLTSVYETSSQELNWGICVTLPDNHGYSAGIIQFTTGTGSAQKVISTYASAVGPNHEFTPYNPTLSSIAAQAKSGGGPVGTLAGLEGYCEAWQRASQRKEFKIAQVKVLNELYWDPSQTFASELGLRTAAARAQIFDCTIQLGSFGTAEIVKSIPPLVAGGDEGMWLDKFLDARARRLGEMGGAYAPTVTRVNSYRHILRSNNLNFAGDEVEALNNDGQPITVSCHSSLGSEEDDAIFGSASGDATFGRGGGYTNTPGWTGIESRAVQFVQPTHLFEILLQLGVLVVTLNW
ncbi:hypothetical protein HDV05_002557 [Chytridiales sp. JEL 0842]|nr:hypothetical protein HDV05_002557 [Chytridiales sp. JEL 0842]